MPRKGPFLTNDGLRFKIILRLLMDGPPLPFLSAPDRTRWYLEVLMAGTAFGSSAEGWKEKSARVSEIKMLASNSHRTHNMLLRGRAGSYPVNII
jgi:hypothetical protein